MSITIKLRRPIKRDPMMTEERARELYTKLKQFLYKYNSNQVFKSGSKLFGKRNGKSKERDMQEIQGSNKTSVYIAWEGKVDNKENEITFEEFQRFYKIILISRGDHAA